MSVRLVDPLLRSVRLLRSIVRARSVKHGAWIVKARTYGTA